MGNPTSYYNGTRWTMEWEHGRELRTISDGSTTWTNTYNADGLRIRRTDGTNTYNYVYLGGQLVKATYNDTAVMYFAYDAEGRPMSVKYNGTTYYYVTNLQGDVVGIVNQSGNKIVSYAYDAWGNLLSTTGSSANTLGKYNPLRYRGYVFDRETGFYYLQSRYYDPEIGRFINADALVSTGQGILGNNMYAYCNNNPTGNSDTEGNLPRGITNPNPMGRDSGSSLRPISDKDQGRIRSNTNENAVIKAEDYAYYKGVLYVKVPGDSAFSYGIVFFGRNADQVDIVRHEYGHYLHLSQIGLPNYTLKVVLPSLIDYWTDVPYGEYYSEPQEYIADILGGVVRTNNGMPYLYEISNTEAIMYYLYSWLP